jgi:hypothetical protein
MYRLFVMLAAVAFVALAVGCPEPVVGDWIAIDDIGGEYNEMELQDDLEGSATIYFYYDYDLYYTDFDVTAEKVENGVYEIEYDADGSDLDLTVECELNRDKDELECKHNKGDLWESYVDGGALDWELD